jgi:hypothetical protein
MGWKHGLCSDGKKHQLLRTWCEMRYRCENPKKWQYKYYGAKGIRVCDRWQRFENFVADMGEKPEGTTLDRIDSAGDYAPENCRWATKKQQMNNYGWNHWITVSGESLTLSQASERYGVKLSTIWRRLKVSGWTEQDAATVQPRAQRI